MVSGFSYKENNYNDNDDANDDNFQVREAYRVFDKERVGHITADELRSNENLRFQCYQWKLSKYEKNSKFRMIFRSLPERLSEAEIDEMLAAADTDGDDY